MIKARGSLSATSAIEERGALAKPLAGLTIRRLADVSLADKRQAGLPRRLENGQIVAAAALMTGWIAARTGLRPEPFYPGILFVVLGLGLSLVLVRETSPYVAVESAQSGAPKDDPTQTDRRVFWQATWANRNLSTISHVGLVNNLNDGMAWGLFPLFFAAADMGLEQIGMLAAVYPATWGVTQLATGTLSDRLGRKWLIASGMWLQALGIGVVILSISFTGFATGAALLGIGTAMVYPTLLAAIGDVARPSWRASAVGVYRLWRDLGYAFGAVLAGVAADVVGLPGAMWLVAGVTFTFGVVAAVRLDETLQLPTSWHKRSIRPLV